MSLIHFEIVTVSVICVLQITYEGHKQYVDEAGRTQTVHVTSPVPIELRSDTSCTVNSLLPNTQYKFSISAFFIGDQWGDPVTRLVLTSTDG